MMGNPFTSWFTKRHRRSIAMALTGWMSLSLVLVFWPCCVALANALPPAVSTGVDGHGHEDAPPGTDGPCRAWLDTADAALNSSPDSLRSGFEPEVVQAFHPGSPEIPVAVPAAPGLPTYHASPPASLPLYLRLQHLLI